MCKFETANYFYGELWDNRKFRSALGAFSKEATGYESVNVACVQPSLKWVLPTSMIVRLNMIFCLL